jgi:PAS domain S-box-containing protein
MMKIGVREYIEKKSGYIDELPKIIKRVLHEFLMEKKLQESEELSRQIIASSNDCIKVLDLKGRLLSMSEGGRKLLEIDDISLYLNKSWVDFWKGKDRDAALEAISKASNGDVGIFSGFCETAKGTPKWWEIIITPMKESHGAIKRLLAVSRDITGRRLVQDQLQKTNRRLDILLSSLYAGVLTTSKDGEVEHVNQAFCDLFNLPETPAGLRGLSSPEMLKKIAGRYSDPVATIARIQKLVEEGKPVKGEEIAMRDGRFFLVDFIPITDKDGNRCGRIWHHQDITGRKRAEMALRESEEKWRLLVQTIPDFVALHDREGRFEYLNHYAAGYSEKDVIGKSLYDFVSPEFKELFRKKFEECIKSAKLMAFEYRAMGDNGIMRDYDNYLVPIKQQDSVVNAMVISRDVTELKQAEAKQKVLEEQLRQSQKLEAIGQLAGGIAHDFNNLMGAISGFSDLIKMNSSSKIVSDYADKIVSVIYKAAGLTRQLLTFARKSRMEMAPGNVHECLKQVVELLGHSLDKHIAISLQLSAENYMVECDLNQLENAFLNLGINARDAMPEGGRLQFKTENITLDNQNIADVPCKVVPDDYLKISISDTGCGMDEETKRCVFEPFYTTKEIGKGTGLGLASVYGCIKSHKGYITFGSKQGFGTTFYIFLPLIENESKTPSITSQRTVEKGAGSILLVDDDDDIRENTQTLLTTLGYTVVACANGEEALAYYEKNHTHIDCVMLDIIMPGKNGFECLRRLKAINANVKVIIISGYGAINDEIRIIKEGAEMFINKPFHVEELSHCVAEVLNKK